MYMKVCELKKCRNCHRLIDSRKLPIHYEMCSTMHLRQTQVFKQKQKKH